MNEQTVTSGVLANPAVRRWGPVLAAVLVTVAGVRACSTPATQAQERTAPTILSGPTTTTAPTVATARQLIDPLSGLGGPLNPTAAAIVGPTYEARLELARRLTESQQRYVVPLCGLFIGADATGTWEVSTVHGPAHPVPVLGACPWPTTTTTTKGA